MGKLKLVCHTSFGRLALNLQNPTHASEVSQATSVQDCTGHKLSFKAFPDLKCCSEVGLCIEDPGLDPSSRPTDSKHTACCTTQPIMLLPRMKALL